jgi:hypothetical protein
MHGFATGTTGATTERREWREQSPHYCFGRGGSPAARGRDNIGNPSLPPYYVDLEVCMASGWAYNDYFSRCYEIEK